MLIKRNRLGTHEIEVRGENIQKWVIRSRDFQSARIIGAYSAFGSEVKTDLIIAEARKLGKTVALPTVEGDKIAFYELSSGKYLVKGRFGIMEPLPYGAVFQMDMLVTPGVAFDNSGYRLGYGKGYYDRFLSEHQTFSVGLAYDFQILDKLPRGKHDIIMNAVATESRIFKPAE